MAALDLTRDQSVSEMMFNLRRAFSGVVAGISKSMGLLKLRRAAPFNSGEPAVLEQLDELLKSFIAHGRMRLPGRNYTPCYEVVSS